MALSITEREQLKEKLLSRIQCTLTKITRMKDMTQPVSPENSIGWVSRLDAINNKSVIEAALFTARMDLDAMQSALQRLDTDESFGQGRQIPFQRLALMPGSTKCVHCA